MYFFNQKSKIPLHIQLFEQLKDDIRNNKKVGDKLDSIRKTAQEYNLSKTTVESAYSQLVAEGYIDSVSKSGYFVADAIYEELNSTNNISYDKEKKEEEYLYDFKPVRLEKEFFPLKIWKRIFNKVINKNVDFGEYKNGQGEYGLRKEISNYLIESRAVKCKPEQIIVCNGFADSMGLLARLVKEDFTSLAMEHPGYYIAKNVFKDYGFKTENIAMTNKGIDLKLLEESNAKLVYVTPTHQYPLGVAMPISNRQKLLKWANENKALIIEDDYDSELSYVNRPVPSLQGLDNGACVVYVGTFSKALSPALRVSYMVLPHFLISKYKQSFEVRASRVCITTQETLATFIKEGYWDKHLRRVRTQNKKKHNLMKKLLKEKLGNSFKIESSGGGLAILINPTVKMDFKVLDELAKKEKIKLYFLKEKVGKEWDALMMGFGGFKEEELEVAIEEFSKVWKKAIL